MLLFKLIMAALVLAASTEGAHAESIAGTIWRNPANSVHIRMEPCGEKMCGVVVWANEKAKADAHKGSAAPLIGAQLFRNFVRKKPSVWQGRVFVPDIGQTFAGHVTILDNNRIEARGCLVGRVACRSQISTRVDKRSAD